MADITVLANAFLIDCTGNEPMEGAAVVVEGERIKDVVRSGKVGSLKGRVDTLDLKGDTLMPGLTDAHVHICAVDGNITDQHRYHPPSLIAAKSLKRIEQALLQGFTTVRGHGDKRRRAEWIEPVDCCIGMIGSIADGEAEVRKAVREQLRRDVDQIKVMASGGAMSPADELDTTQFTVAELRAAVEEAAAVGKYVLAHAYSGAAVTNAVEAGVRSIEHGNLIDEAAAKALKAAGAFLVPTMVTYEAIWREGKAHGIGDHQLQKINVARERSVESLALARRLDLKIGSGSDLLGDMMAHRAAELELKGQVLTPMEVLVSATRTNAELFRMQDRIGTVEPGKLADLLVVKGNPLRDLRLFQNPGNLLLIMKGGVIYKRTL